MLVDMFQKKRQVFQPNVLPILRWAVVQPNMGQKPKETHDLEHNDIMFPMKTAMTGEYWRYTYAKWNSARPIP